MHTIHIVEFLLWLLIAASVIAILTHRFRLPYTVFLVLGGFAIDLFRGPLTALLGEGLHSWFTPEIVFILFLPGLVFEAGLNVHVKILRENLLPILLLAIVGVLVATAITGAAVAWVTGIPLLVALLFGSLISATDPISVLALFKDLGVSRRLSTIVEAESLLNDGTAIVIFQILIVGVTTGQVGLLEGIWRFLVVAIGGAALGLALGFIASKVHERVDEPRIEILLTTILAYGSYLIAERLHVSGVIATVAAGLMVGSYGADIGMSPRTRAALWSFWDYLAFVINSLVFLLIGMEVHVLNLLSAKNAILLAIGAVLLGRVLSVYLVTPVSNLWSRPISLRWQHVLVWGGIHGTVSMALALSLPANFPYRQEIVVMTFGVVAFSLIVQGLTVKPLVGFLKIEREAPVPAPTGD